MSRPPAVNCTCRKGAPISSRTPIEGTSHLMGFFITFVENSSQNRPSPSPHGNGTGKLSILCPTSESKAGSRVSEYIRAPRTARNAPIPMDGICVAVK